MKRTRKWAYVAQEAQRLAALGLAPSVVAQRIGVDSSTVRKWIRSGKLVRRAGVTPGSGPPTAGSPAEWARVVRMSYALDATDDQLVTLAEATLRYALDPGQPLAAQCLAMGRFQALVKQLKLVTRPTVTEAEAPPVVEPPRPTRGPRADPRGSLMVQ